MMVAGFKPARVVPFVGITGHDLNEVSFCAWVAQAEPGETLVYHRGFLAVDATSVISKLPSDQQRVLRLMMAEVFRGLGCDDGADGFL